MKCCGFYGGFFYGQFHHQKVEKGKEIDIKTNDITVQISKYCCSYEEDKET